MSPWQASSGEAVHVTLEFIGLSDAVAGEWDRLVRGSPDGWADSLSAAQRMLVQVKEWQVTDHSFAVYQDGTLVAVMPLLSTALSNPVAGISFTGPAVAGELSGDRRKKILAATFGKAKLVARANNWPKLSMLVPAVTRTSLQARWGVNPFVFHGFAEISVLSQVIDLAADEATLLAGTTPDTRRLIRRAADRGLETRAVEWPEFLDAYYAAHCETFTRNGKRLHPRSFFEGFAYEMAPAGHAELFATFTSAREPIAFVHVTRFGESALYHTGCSHAAALRIGANHLLMWEAILSAKRSGCRWFDMGTIHPTTQDAKEAGLTQYKTRFGGEAHRVFCCDMTISAE
jgi:lipid II:glycine glycyltransferase (peptidoglycan interpeptide bridge formation enzyme)